tara:strand:+ start:1787 stop:2050 length:264 start_codon:yes stop_codon:yes gene_type:complete
LLQDPPDEESNNLGGLRFFYQEPNGKMGGFSCAMFVTPNSLKYNESGNLGEWGESDERFPLLVESVIHRYDSVCSFSFFVIGSRRRR